MIVFVSMQVDKQLTCLYAEGSSCDSEATREDELVNFAVLERH